MKKNVLAPILILSALITCFSCKKNWLDAKPTKSLVIPNTIRDYLSLLSGTTSGAAFNEGYGTLPEHSATDFYITDTNWNAADVNNRNFYAWIPDVWAGNPNYTPWTRPYRNILYTNVVLEGIETIIPVSANEQKDWSQVKGGALFLRACWHYDIAKQFCKVFNKATASTDLGIPLRLNSDFNEVSVRSSVEQTYNQIINDLKESAEILPISTPINDIYKCQPTKAAAYAMLARVYLSMSDFDSAFIYADKTLQLHNFLLDFNITSSTPTATTVAINSNGPFARFNNEVLFHMKGTTYSIFSTAQLIIDPALFNSYDLNDRRRNAYFRTVSGKITLKGTYDQSLAPWTGLATDEMYLIRAECFARKGNKAAALSDLNTLMVKRWRNDNNSWVPFDAIDANDALKKILIERRKELWFRSIRWTDLKRLNLESQFAVSLTKTINGQTHILAPNSSLYVFPIPPDVIQLTGMLQNPR